MRRPRRWKAWSAAFWPVWGSPTPTRSLRETMADPHPTPDGEAHRLSRGVLHLFDRFRSKPAQEAAQEPEPPTAATGQLVTQARAFQDLRVDDVMKPRADIVAVDRSCPFS